MIELSYRTTREEDIKRLATLPFSSKFEYRDLTLRLTVRDIWEKAIISSEKLAETVSLLRAKFTREHFVEILYKEDETRFGSGVFQLYASPDNYTIFSVEIPGISMTFNTSEGYIYPKYHEALRMMLSALKTVDSTDCFIYDDEPYHL